MGEISAELENVRERLSKTPVFCHILVQIEIASAEKSHANSTINWEKLWFQILLSRNVRVDGEKCAPFVLYNYI